LLPNVEQIVFNDFNSLDAIDKETACVVMETLQAEAGTVVAKDGFIQAVRNRCNEVGALLIFDEIQLENHN
jgi:acetylornithine/succinyldiaminopimelate/putrescine aminotransferase